MLPTPAVDLDITVFPADYAAARAGFLAAARAVGAVSESFLHPLRGPAGETLATDIAWVGPRGASRLLVTQSALHGVEGFAGAAAQRDFLRYCPATALPPDVAILHIHALNPWGFAWLRRTNEEGVDLNRNVVDFDAPLPANAGYDALADILLPHSSTAEALAQADLLLAEYVRTHGRDAFERAVTGGQYRHPTGLFFGGHASTWSQRLLQDLLTRYALRDRALVTIVDVHTGLGPFGYGEVICDHPPASYGVALAHRFFGASVTEPALGTSTSVPKTGLLDYLWHRELPERCCCVTLEFGTWPLARMFPVLRADQLLHRCAPPAWQAADTQRIKADMRHHFYPASPDWQQLVLFRSRQVFLQALAGLGAA